MGLMKRLVESQDDYGFRLSPSDHYRDVCAGCIEDAALARYLESNGPIDACSFCSATGVHGTSVASLFKYMSGKLSQEYTDPTRVMGWDRGWTGPTLDSDDLLWELDQPLGHDDLRWLFVFAFEHEWCRVAPYSLPHDERLSLSWDRFSDYVKTRGRYLFLRTGRCDGSPDSERYNPSDVLDEVHKAIVNAPVVKRLDAGTQTLWRARPHDPDLHPRSSDELGSPPVGHARASRMSPPGISMFYAAESVETALAEVGPPNGNHATVAAWTTTRDLTYLDLAALPPVPSIFDLVASRQRVWLKFLHRFAEEIARPVEPDAGAVEYVPTQIFTEYLRDVPLHHDGSRIEAIRYRSATHPGGMCWTVFAGPQHCGTQAPQLLQLIPGKTRRYRSSWSRSETGAHGTPCEGL